MKKAASFSEAEQKILAKAGQHSRVRGGVRETMMNGGGPYVTGSADLAGNTRGIMRNGGNTPRNVPLPTGKVKDTMKQ